MQSNLEANYSRMKSLRKLARIVESRKGLHLEMGNVGHDAGPGVAVVVAVAGVGAGVGVVDVVHGELVGVAVDHVVLHAGQNDDREGQTEVMWIEVEEWQQAGPWQLY